MRTIGFAVLGFFTGLFLSETLFGRGDTGLWPGSIVVALVCAAVAALLERRTPTKR
jgi:hypothetical protein